MITNIGWLADIEWECPKCLDHESLEDIQDRHLGQGFVTSGDIREGTLEIYGCTNCGGSGGGLEPSQDDANYPIGKSWLDRLRLMGVQRGTGRIAPFASLRIVQHTPKCPHYNWGDKRYDPTQPCPNYHCCGWQPEPDVRVACWEIAKVLADHIDNDPDAALHLVDNLDEEGLILLAEAWAEEQSKENP